MEETAANRSGRRGNGPVLIPRDAHLASQLIDSPEVCRLCSGGTPNATVWHGNWLRRRETLARGWTSEKLWQDATTSLLTTTDLAYTCV